MAGAPADAQGSTTLKALAPDKISTCILQSTHLRRNSAHTEIVTKGPKDLSLKIPTAKTTGELLENMPSAMAAFDSHLDNAIRSSSMLQEVQSIVIDNPHIPPISNAVQDTSSDR